MSNPPAELVLLLHGQPGGVRDWDRVSELVQRARPGTRLLAIDRPGWRPGSRPTDLAGNARTALAALDAQRARRAVVVGHSLGGAVAAWLACEHPERVSRLVLAAPAANRASLVPLDHVLAWPLVGELVGAATLAGAGLALWPARTRGTIARLLGLDVRYLEGTARYLRRPRAWRAFAADQRMLVRDLPALEARLPSIAVPTTIVGGSADRVVPLASARALAATIPGARLVVLPGAGHLLLQREAEQLADIIAA
jgi:pimeloyl-ACP methyl ester carboxylesterase